PGLGHLADHSNREPRTGKGMPIEQLVGQTELASKRAHLILEQLAQRLHQLELHHLRQAAHVVMALDGGARALEGYGFDHVGIQRSLRQVSGILEFARRLLEDGDELSADDLPLLLRIHHSLELAQKSLPRVYRL